MTGAGAVADSPLFGESVSAVMRLAGRQRTDMTVHHGGTQEAYAVVTVGRSVIYMHTRMTTERFGEIWQNAQPWALHLPRARELRPLQALPPDTATPNVVVHPEGQPEASVRLSRTVPKHLSVTIGDLAFLIYDQRAFASCSEPFLLAMEAGRTQLPRADLRLDPVRRAEPALAGEAAERAAATLLQPQQPARAHPALRAAASFRPQATATTTRTTGKTSTDGAGPRQLGVVARVGLDKPQGPTAGRSR